MNDAFDREAYGPVFANLIGDEPAMPLDEGSANRGMRGALDSAAVESAFAGHGLADRGAADCCLAAVWLLHGFLDEAHSLCQAVPSPSGSYWHGVMHRREGDYGNAQYWFRRAGDHPAGELVAPVAAGFEATSDAADGGVWDASRFVNLVQRAVREGGDLAEACVAVQRAEWRALFDHCWRDATG